MQSMNVAAYRALLVILLGIASTTQLHLAKALERQGIEVWDLIKARLRRTSYQRQGNAPLIYGVGLILNHTTFVYHLFVAPLGGTTALYTSMYGIGLVALLLYSTRVMGEELTCRELLGAVAILCGTLVVGVEGSCRPALDMAQMDLGGTLTALAVVLAGCLALLVGGLKNGFPDTIGLAFGLSAGACGALDPFLKAVGQTTGGGGHFLPQNVPGWLVLAASFVLGEVAVLVTQWAFYRRARANILVPAYNCSYVAVPVVLQALLLPGYDLYWTTGLGLGLIMFGFVRVRGFVRERRTAHVPMEPE
jgi:uncharacterized membrane protein